MFFQLVGHDVFVELLVHGGVISLIRLDHTINWAVEFLEEDFFNAHGHHPY